MGIEFKYDVAFSFLAKDEHLAIELQHHLVGRTCFVYSEHQKDLAGKDGEATFSRVFMQEARLVVVLYRPAWGETPWTRIEETAIRNRGFEFGYDFCLFVALDDNASAPVWLPKNRLWIGNSRFGAPGTVAVIEARLQEVGLMPAIETLEEMAARRERERNYAEARDHYFMNGGVQKAEQSFNQLIDALGNKLKDLQEKSPSLGISLKSNQRELIACSKGPALSVEWHREYVNSMTGAKITLALWRGHPPWPGLFFIEKPCRLASIELDPDMTMDGEACWKVERGKRTIISSEDLTDYVVRWWFEQSDRYVAH